MGAVRDDLSEAVLDETGEEIWDEFGPDFLYGMPAPTAGELIAQTMRRIGALGVGQTADAYHALDCLKLLNIMLSHWNRRRWLVWHLKDVACTATGEETYTVGNGEQFDVTRPDKIELAYVRQTGKT